MAIAQKQGYEVYPFIDLSNMLFPPVGMFIESLGKPEAVLANDKLYVNVSSQTELDAAWNSFDFTTASKTMKWEAVRAKRNALLAATDFTQVADYPGDKSGYVSYREELRNIPQNYPDPDQVVWPTAPGA